jgi:hypothetical protein
MPICISLICETLSFKLGLIKLSVKIVYVPPEPLKRFFNLTLRVLSMATVCLGTVPYAVV